MISSPVRTKLAAALCALAVPAAVAGCGGGLSGNAVATVGGSSAITRSAFDHWLSVTAKSSGQQASAVPKPPDFKACIATQRKTLPKPTKGQPTVTDAQLKTQCSKQYTMLRDSVLQFLISEKWLEGEAKDLGLKVTDAEVRKQFETMKKASFKTEAEYQKFLKQSGQSEQDILLRFRSDVLVTKIRDKITKGKDQVPDAAVARYYNANKARFAQPARRDLLVVKTKTKAKAEQAKKRIAKGEDFAKVAKAVSIDAQSKGMGGKLLATQGQLEKPFDSAIFKAKKGALNGPVKTQAGFYVFKVTKITPASQQSQQQASTTIKQLLASQQQQQALDKFVKNYTKKWKSRTVCRKGFVTTDCKNGPPIPTPTATPPGGGSVPQTQQAPPSSGGGTAPQTQQAPPSSGGGTAPQTQQAPPPSGGSVPQTQAPPAPTQ